MQFPKGAFATPFLYTECYKLLFSSRKGCGISFAELYSYRGERVLLKEQVFWKRPVFLLLVFRPEVPFRKIAPGNFQGEEAISREEYELAGILSKWLFIEFCSFLFRAQLVIEVSGFRAGFQTHFLVQDLTQGLVLLY